MLLAEMKVMATYRQKEERELDEDGNMEIDELRIMFLSCIETCIPLRPEHSPELVHNNQLGRIKESQVQTRCMAINLLLWNYGCYIKIVSLKHLG